VVAVAPFSHRLAFHDLPDEIQHLRCKVNFEALRFVPSIDQMGNILVERLRKSQARNVGGDDGYYKYLALHLRFDKVTRKRQLFISVVLQNFQKQQYFYQCCADGCLTVLVYICQVVDDFLCHGIM
jgi:hypothetical protein